MSMFVEHILHEQFDQNSVAFQIKILEKSGFSEETCIPPYLSQLPIKKSLSFNRDEATTVIFTVVKEVLETNNINPKAIDILIINSSMFSPTPSLSAMIINKFRMRSNIMSFNLSGMGCSAGIISVGLANDLLRVHRNSLALVVSSEILSQNWYTGKDRSMLLTNCLFRMGGAAILMSSRDQDKKKAKYVLQNLVRTNRAEDDLSYACVFQEVDNENKVGVSISKKVMNAAGEALKANMVLLGPMVLPLTEQFQYGLSSMFQKMKILSKKSIHIPDFRKGFEHFCIHAGGRAVILAIEKSLKLRQEDVEASKMTLHRFGNTSSSSIWYELSYIEAKGRMREGDRIWQIAFGSGFKCNSAVWKCACNVKPEKTNAWMDTIDSYPVDLPDTLEIL
ncbi:putative 3-ketoacyl-CoA synthase 20 [Abeliophyllum distichum]|uniref:very-long-chain 3-oxoacyl-CoA synthase n=1 Tax=Abeliophyllum distichum TaxID=126358 RepID=A0ABD1Q5C3_9LAMI